MLTKFYSIFVVAVMASILMGTAPLFAKNEAGQSQKKSSSTKPNQKKGDADTSTDSDESVDKSGSGWAALPIISYSPETNLSFGGFGVHFFRLGNAPVDSRTSSLALVLLYTTRQQFIGELIPELYWDNERWHIWSKLDFRHYPNSFWGIGNDTPDSQLEEYNETGPRWQIWIRRLIYLSLYLEHRIDAQYMRISQVKSGGLLDMMAVPGARAGRTIGTGMTLGWDTRDHAFAPHQGALYEATLMTWQRYVGSEYSYNRLSFDLRQFVPVTETHTLALQLYSAFMTGEVPYYQLAMIGGQRLLRGYFEGRYRDNDMVAFQVEYRLPIWWRFSGVVFTGIGEVADRLEAFDFSSPKWTVGGGLRVILHQDERLLLRFDAGFGDGTHGVYVNVHEAF